MAQKCVSELYHMLYQHTVFYYISYPILKKNLKKERKKTKNNYTNCGIHYFKGQENHLCRHVPRLTDSLRQGGHLVAP